jgi:putative glycosyltransferase (TIGR04372 family)
MGKFQLVNKIKIILIYSIYFRIFSFLYLNFRLLNFLGLHVATNFSQKKNRYPLANFILTRKRQYKLNLYSRLELLAHRHHELAEMKASSRFHEYSEALRLQELLLVSKPLDSNRILTFFGRDLTTNIGHMSLNISLRVKMQKLFPDIYPFNHELIYGHTQNENYLRHYSGYFNLRKVSDLEAIEMQTTLWPAQESYGAIWTPQGPMNNWKANDTYSREYERIFPKPILTLDDRTKEAGFEFLGKFGFTPSDWFITLHVRSANSGPGVNHRGFQYGRNADIKDYLPAIKYITERGGWVIRIGDKGSPNPLYLPNAIDYTIEDIQDDKLNTFFLANCEFMIGTNSGPICVPSTFGKPVVMTNCPSIARNTYFSNSIFVPKLVKNRQARILTLEELFDSKVGYSEFWLDESKGYEWINNSEEDIINSVTEMLSRNSKDLTVGQIGFDQICRDLGTDAIGTISNSFIELHKEELNLAF